MIISIDKGQQQILLKLIEAYAMELSGVLDKFAAANSATLSAALERDLKTLDGLKLAVSTSATPTTPGSAS